MIYSCHVNQIFHPLWQNIFFGGWNISCMWMKHIPHCKWEKGRKYTQVLDVLECEINKKNQRALTLKHC
jgi:hypothetical protein